MRRNTPVLALFPETAGTSYTEDGIGIYRDRHATSKVEEQNRLRKEAREKKRKKLAKKKLRSARKVSVGVSVKVTVEVTVTVTTTAPARPCCACDPKAASIAFEDNPYAMSYRRRPLY